MAETADYDPGEWRGYDYAAARKSYDAHAGRSYADATSSGKTAGDLVPAKITTTSDAPLMVICDVTGSMGDWPATIFSKLPYLDKEGAEYLGPDMAVCFGAVGDALHDKYPLQVQEFGKGLELTDRLKALVVEGGGGSNAVESYDLAALYMARNIDTPNAVHRPIAIFIGDEGVPAYVTAEQAKRYGKMSIEGPRISAQAIFDELKARASVYVIRKAYGGEGSTQNREVHNQWVGLLGDDHVCMLPSADRVVDVIFGILAQETNRVDYFKGEIEGRQRKDQVDTVYKSLKTIHAATPGTAAVPLGGKSVNPDKGKSRLLQPGDAVNVKKSRLLKP